MPDEQHLSIDTSAAASTAAASASSARPSPVTGLTTFPNPFEDEPEPGLLPSLLSKVKSTFSAAPPKPDTRPAEPKPAAQTEAQQIAVAARRQAAAAQPAQPTQKRSAMSQLSIPSGDASPAHRPSPTANVAAALPLPSTASQSLATPSTNSSATPSVNSSLRTNPQRRHLVPGERNWRPAGAAPAQVTVSPVTSVTTTVHSKLKDDPARSHPRLLQSHATLPAIEGGVPRLKTISSSSLGGPRMRRGSISTIPDSPSSVSLSAMISANAELSQNNYSFVPGFQLPAEDTRSVRSLGFVKRPGSVSKIIRRMRGEGLSKHYWMADEHCKECYDCKSVFTTWRRKHHCRICGQIFCGRCASNIIGARRFGQDGMVRVCNLCLKIMEDYDDDDDRRSINSSMSMLPDRVRSPEIPYSTSPYSPYAASQLFQRQPSESLSAIDESAATRYWPRGSSEIPERPFTPEDPSDASDSEEGGHLWHSSQPAPFRRMNGDDNSDDQAHSMAPSQTPSPSPGMDVQRRRIDFPHEIGHAAPHIAFPRTETMESEDGRFISDSMHQRLLQSRLTSMASTGGLNALLDTDRKDGLWRARSYSFVAPGEYISGPSLVHFNTMLKQALEQENVPHPNEWHRVLSRLLLRVSTNLRPAIRAGDSIDVRTYIKFKKVPGGKISDSEYVDGIVITKNVAHKGMARRLVNPRIMVITFPLDYHRVETQFMSLDPILKQERDYLRLLTNRIIDLRPHIVLVERFVSRIALEFLHQANIVVARGVKFSAIHQVARCTHADIVSSMDRLVLEPRLGRCADFRVQTFEHELIPGRRKTYMRFEGTHNGFGGTIILRGEDLQTLRKIKLLADFNALVAYHLKNEAFLYGDEFHMVPPRPPMPQEFQDLLDLLTQYRERGTYTERGNPLGTPMGSESGDKERERQEAEALTIQIAESLEPYLTTILSASVAVRFPPPYALAKMAALDRMLNELRQKHDEKEAEAILQDEKREPQSKALIPASQTANAILAKVQSPIKDQAPALVAPTPVAATQAPVTILVEGEPKPAEAGPSSLPKEGENAPAAEPATSLATAPVSTSPSTTAPAPVATAVPSAPSTPSPTPIPATPTTSATTSQILAHSKAGDPYRVLLNPNDFLDDSRLAFVEHEHSQQLKIWQHYVKKNPGPLLPKNYQGIVYIKSLYRQGQDKPCVEPMRAQINFYQEDDQTLGQFLGSMVANAGHRCPNKNCDHLMLFHYDVLVHGERRLQIVMEQFMCPLAGHEEHILTWSYCRQCNKSWEPTVIREETWRMSWGAYLEHCFYPPRTATGLGCAHDAYREHIRYFAHHNMVVRIHNDSIELFEPVRPSIKLMTKVEDKVAIRNQEYESALQKTQAFFDSVLFRLRSFSDDLVDPDKLPGMRKDRDALLTRAVADRDEMVNSLNRTYKQAPPTDVLAINVVLQALQDKVIQWDLDFLEVEKLYMPTEKDLRRMTATHLKRLFATQDVFGSLDKNMAAISVPEVDEKEKGDSEPTDAPSKPSTPVEERPQDEAASSSEPVPQADAQTTEPPATPATNGSVVASSETVTPTATLVRSAPNPVADADTTRDYDSDSTISAVPRRPLPKTYTPIADRPSSGIDSDVQHPGFVSRLPRRARQPPSVADLVRRFQDSVGGQEFEPIPDVLMERPRSTSGALRRNRHERSEVSDSDLGAGPSRPRLRRGRTAEQGGASRHARDPRSNLLSDGDRSYAVNASRVVSSAKRGDPSGSRGRLSRATSPSGLRPKDMYLAAPSPRVTVSKTMSTEGKPRIAGKGKTPRKASEPPLSLGQASPATIRPVPRRVVGAGSRVTSIARHFDKLSREAERDRQKRISAARGKRAGRVGVTKAKVQFFSNVRDAFRDEFDSDSSGADNEEDDGDASDASVDSTGRAKPRRKQSSPSARRPVVLSIVPIDVPEAGPSGSKPQEVPKHPDQNNSALDVSAPSSFMSESTMESRRPKDRLHIELAPFDTNAPLPPPTPLPQLTTTDLDEGGTRKGLSALSQMSESEMSSGGGGERSSILKTLTGLWAFRAGDFTPLEYPLSAAEHIFVDSRVIVRENEPTSIIAFTLSSKPYRDQMRTMSNLARARRHEPSHLDDMSGTSDRQWDIISVDEAMETDDVSRRETGSHLKYEFEAGSSTISCRIFFAEQFAALRQACQCEDSFVESLARCAKFDASGGKSGSAFLKTKDDRFIVKEISRLEMDAITKFAPAYFEYTSTAFQRGRPTALAKTYGIFKIGFRNAVTGVSMHMNVLVQENLFYGRQFTKIYDLKGSTRNRLIKPTGKVNEVLLDENLMELSYTNPLYLRDHSKRILRTALWNDTLFLSNLNVMDYSLVVGVDVEHQQLVVGVVDYIRTFTWDKKVESWVKDFGGGGRGEPTIVTPLQYRKRFRTAMERIYFPAVPDRWSAASGDDAPMDEESATLLNI
ncbi:Mitochondrial distribution and morphology protein 12 [Vanrija albida]|uniref:1-phosphatidylinositol-3-phosphate 5-kinase n=1 Tax=Vanrija albida TaxID=181172 RepID=A0ABR3QEP0_9TREE